MHPLTAEAGGDVEATGDVAVLSVVVGLAIGITPAGSQRHALADLNQRRVAFGGLNLLGATAAAVGAAADDAHLVAAIDFALADLYLGIASADRAVGAVAAIGLKARLIGVDADQQAPWLGIELLQQGAHLGHLP